LLLIQSIYSIDEQYKQSEGVLILFPLFQLQINSSIVASIYFVKYTTRLEKLLGKLLSQEIKPCIEFMVQILYWKIILTDHFLTVC